MTFFQSLILDLMSFVIMTIMMISLYNNKTKEDRIDRALVISSVMVFLYVFSIAGIQEVHDDYPEYFRFTDRQFIKEDSINNQNEYYFLTSNVDITEVNPDNKSIVSEGTLDLSDNVLLKTHILSQEKDKMLIDFDLVQPDGHHKHELGLMSKKEYMGHIEPLIDFYAGIDDAFHDKSKTEEFSKHTAHSLTDLKTVIDH